MLYAVRHPVALVGLLVGFLVGLVLHGVAQAWLAARLGDRTPLARGQGRPDPRRHIDPFGAVAAVLGGVGWGTPVLDDTRRLWRRGRVVAVAAIGPLVNVVLGAAGLALFLAAGGARASFDLLNVGSVLHGLDGPSNQVLALSFGYMNLAIAVLSLVPMPPLEGGMVLFRLAPRTHGWQVAEYRLAEQNWGVGILLVLLILPLAGQDPPLVFLIDAILHPILSSFS